MSDNSKDFKHFDASVDQQWLKVATEIDII